MFGYLRNLLGRTDARHAPLRKQFPKTGSPGSAPVAQAKPLPRPVNRPTPTPRPIAHANTNTSIHSKHGNGSGIHIPLQSILAGLPLELQKKVRQSAVGDMTVSVALERILSQLNTGVVKILFGELRAAAPEIFSSTSDCDQMEVLLPLGEILQRLNPALFVRRTNQTRAEVPADIVGPFGRNGEGLIFPAGSDNKASATPPRAITPAAPGLPPSPIVRKKGSTQIIRVAPKPPVIPKRNDFAAVRPPLPPVAMPPVLPKSVNKPADLPKPTPPTPAAAPTPAPAALQGLAASMAPANTPTADSAPIPFSPVFSAPEPTREVPALIVALTTLAKAWPESVRQEIAQLNLQEANVNLPVDVVEPALKQGKVAFTWRVLRSWIKPALAPNVSVHDATALVLPLDVLAPLFLTRQKAAGVSHRKVAIDENIPNLFFGFPQPDAPASAPVPETGHAITKPVDTNYYKLGEVSETPKADEDEIKQSAPTPATTFTSRCATPNEIVSRASALEGVAGALVALPDGLMVANRIPSDLNGDTLAAFLPQIFSKVSQCTRELRMGELNNLNFTVGNVPWKIFRVNAIFFAAFGRAGEPLPTAQLASLAAELDRKKN